ncbi:MAG: two-component system response regulator [Nitrospirae bacterium RBG_19FT_COMBO_42_15]|nr:MAG: two-component system response regulator [Nitrospirae bacterium RBG_19FT_COMBO_42_15]
MKLKNTKILIVDDDESHRQMLKAVLSEENCKITEAADGKDAVALSEKSSFDIILMDIRMSEMSGVDALKIIKARKPDIPILLMTAYGSVKSAVEALKLGAIDYLTKPLDIQELKLAVKNAVKNIKIEEVSDRDFSEIIGRSKEIKEVLETVLRVAPTDATVLISGESGTGKELIANAIHQKSKRHDKPFIKVNCAALTETLLESELFGHEKGAFTGAISKKEGRFELADKGTIFLDEIGDMSPATQAKVLRVLQEKEFERVGGTKTLKIDVRVIAATNKELDKEVKAGRFRDDLFYRLNVVTIHMPSLKERKEDIVPLSDHFLRYYKEKNNKTIKGLHPEALGLLQNYNWPGNVRELENAIERAVIMSRGEYIAPSDFPIAIQSALPSDSPLSKGGQRGVDVDAGKSIKDVEKSLIVRTLNETKNNRTKAAGLLGITRRTLLNKIKEYKIG